MAKISDLLFEISSETRLDIIKKIQAQPLNQTNIAKTANVSLQEVSRHLFRLSEAKIIEKNQENLYQITNFGTLLLTSLSTIEFLVKHNDYLSTHDINSLPLEFVYRLGDLLHSDYSNFVSNTLRHVEQVLDKAEKFVWLISDQPLISEKSILEYCDKKPNLTLKIIIKKSAGKYSLLKQKLGNKFEIKYINNITAGMALNEKIAGVVFSDKKGILDFSSGFVAKDTRSYKWCYDLFIHNWNDV